MTLKNYKKLDEELTCRFKIDISILTNFDLNTGKSQKYIYTVMGCFWLKYMFELKKYREATFYDAREWWKIWRKSDLWFGKWHEEFGKFSLEHTKFQNCDFYCVLLSKVENVWA